MVKRGKNNMIKNIESAIGFPLKNFYSWNSFVKSLFKPADASSLAVSRIFFGAIMLLDIIEERGLGEADLRWGDPNECRFPLFDFLNPLPLEWMCIIYCIMWLGAFGIMLGAYFKTSCLCFIITYWYIIFLDKTHWNNHSYLFGLLGLLFSFTNAQSIWSLDAYFGTSNPKVPIWNYAIIRFQLFILYFYAGLKKSDWDWLTGHSMSSLSQHWVFDPLRPFLSDYQIDHWIIHVCVFIFDLTIGFWIYFDKTRPIAFIIMALFHLMNSQMFQIGVFPWICLATMPLFCSFNWPKQLFKIKDKKTNEKFEKNDTVPSLFLLYICLQLFLPYSHFITKGYNNWTNGLYGYSWDMMVHTWDTVLVTVKIVDNESGEEIFFDPEAWVHTNKWYKHGDMVKQYASCLKRNLAIAEPPLKNISVYLDVWSSLNGRFQQRMFDPRINLITAHWSPFEDVIFLMPLMTEFSHLRNFMTNIEEDVKSWSNHSRVLFVADFPGLYLENYIDKELSNITLSVLEGTVILELENKNRTLVPGKNSNVPAAVFHKIYTVSESPACYMYTFFNNSDFIEPRKKPSIDHFTKIMEQRINNFIGAIALTSNAVLKILYDIPMMRRVKVY